MTRCCFPKTERIYLREAVGKLFAEGKSFISYPFRVVYLVLPSDDAQPAPVAVMTIAPKRRFRHAVHRNRVKRLMREAYRLQKQPLIDAVVAADRKLAVAFTIVDGTLPTFGQTRRAIGKAIQRLSAGF